MSGRDTSEDSIVILGSGMAGGVAARTFREDGYGGRPCADQHAPRVQGSQVLDQRASHAIALAGR